MHKGEKDKIYCASVFKMNQLNIKSQHMSLDIPVCISFKELTKNTIEAWGRYFKTNIYLVLS